MPRKWESFVTWEDVTGAKIIAIRVSDNILDEEDWPVHILKFHRNGVCVRQTVENKGVYKLVNFVGKKLNDLANWSNCDLTGSYGEMFNDLCVLIYF